MMNEKEKHLRPVRSFIRREGRLSPAQQRSIELGWAQYGVDYAQQQVDLESAFGRVAPITLEIGFGMGASFLEMVQAAPENNFIGIEVHRPGVGAFLHKVIKNKLTNVKVITHDAVEVLRDMVPDNSLDKVQIFFPDPWPKKRHHKRRLIQVAFVNEIVKKLKVNGVLHLATDWENYAEHMQEVLVQIPELENQAGAGNFSPRPMDRPLTKYENRGQKLGHNVWDLLFNKMESK